ncbi:MAG TPA: rhomboid family intramembrane serine protease [Lysobacter sp.]|jgi:membrane associated rhomboid family serine protease|nr:rhomboid family intramembrane serine protease [Lysobacter sp.]
MFSRLPPVTKALLIANGLMFLLQLMLGDMQLKGLMLWPLGTDGNLFSQGFMPWQVITYSFLHGNIAHLVFNMITLAMFGAQVEFVWGQRRYLTYYLVCVLGAAVCQLAVGWWTLSHGVEAYPTLGASGGIFGLLLAYGLMFPNQRVMLLFPPVPMKARTLVILYAVAELLLGLNGWQPGVAHFAHLGGMLFGWLLIRYWSGKPPFGKRGPFKPRIVR